jgi:hypothetical protein
MLADGFHPGKENPASATAVKPDSGAVEALTAYYSSAVGRARRISSRDTLHSDYGRRLPRWSPLPGSAFLPHVQSRLEKLAADDSFDESEVIAVTAIAP